VGTIFLSYRRADGGGYAGRIFDRLRAEFGDDAVFRDVDAIASGAHFPEAIARELQSCRVFIPIVGPGWTRATDETGARRLDNPADWVRTEIAKALERKVCIVPVTVGGASVPSASELPENLRELALLQWRDLRDGDTWQGDLDLLVRRVAKEVGGASPLRRRRILAGGAGLLVLGVVGWTAIRYIGPPVPDLTAEPIVIFETGNTKDVEQREAGPPEPTVFVTKQRYFVSHIFTYHWNFGRGQQPDRVSLRRSDGKVVYGPWEVRAFPGHKNAPNVNWVVEPRFLLPPGTYIVVDSKPETWSYNTTSGNRGFAIVKVRPLK
jgi:hypothetical protein